MALLDFPSHANVGDSAIYLGETEYLRQKGHKIRYVCSLYDYNPKHLREAHPEGAILIHGGGNFGDIWGEHQRFREAVIQEFPDRKIIQLPTSIYFHDESKLDQARRILGGHKNFTVLVRDEPSYHIAKDDLGVTVVMCPDMAFNLGGLDRYRKNNPTTLFLSRTDHEKATGIESSVSGFNNLLVQDWLDENMTLTIGLSKVISHYSQRIPGVLRNNQVVQGIYEKAAWQRLDRGCSLLGANELVVTDRLHAHILSLLTGVPHKLIDNNNNKLSNFYAAWTSESQLAGWL